MTVPSCSAIEYINSTGIVFVAWHCTALARGSGRPVDARTTTSSVDGSHGGAVKEYSTVVVNYNIILQKMYPLFVPGTGGTAWMNLT